MLGKKKMVGWEKKPYSESPSFLPFKLLVQPKSLTPKKKKTPSRKTPQQSFKGNPCDKTGLAHHLEVV